MTKPGSPAFEAPPADSEACPAGLPASWRWYGEPLQVAALAWPATPAGPDRRALLLDRDGTLIADSGYLCDPSQVQLVDEAVEALQLARDRGWLLGLVSNQGGIGLERFGWAELAAVQAAVDAALARLGLELDVALVCPYHPQGTHPRFGRSAARPLGRKPGPGMVHLAAELLGLDESSEVLVVGDKASDVSAAAAAGREGLQVETRRVSSGGRAPNRYDREGRDDGWRAVRQHLDREAVGR